MSVHMLSRSNFGNNILAQRSMKLPYQETSGKCKNGLHYTEAYLFLSSFLRSWSFFFNSIMGGGKTTTHREGGIKTTTKKSYTQHSKIWSPKEDNAKQPPVGDHSTILCLPLVMFLHFTKKLLWSLQVHPPNSCSFSAIKGHCFLWSFPLFLEDTLETHNFPAMLTCLINLTAKNPFLAHTWNHYL